MLGCFGVHLVDPNVTCVRAPLFPNIEIEVEGNLRKNFQRNFIKLML